MADEEGKVKGAREEESTDVTDPELGLGLGTMLDSGMVKMTLELDCPSIVVLLVGSGAVTYTVSVVSTTHPIMLLAERSELEMLA